MTKARIQFGFGFRILRLKLYPHEMLHCFAILLLVDHLILQMYCESFRQGIKIINLKKIYKM